LSTTTQITTDYLIIGQGLAGTLLAHFLLEEGQNIHIIDDDYPRAASKVAAGVINPVTGRRYVKSWRIDELLPFAEQTYLELGKKFEIQCYHHRSILRTMFNNGEENNWQARAYDPDYKDYILPKAEVDIGNYAQFTSPAFSYGETAKAAQVDIGTIVRHYRKYFEEKQLISKTVFDFEQLQLTDSGVQYQNICARKVIFCEGAKGVSNPFFPKLSFEINKGEAIIVELPDVDFQKILKHRIFVVPLANGKYWIGSTSEHEFPDDLPSAKGRSYLEEKLKALLKVPFTIEEHRSAIRPAVKDRRPLVGRHSEYPQLFIFNGLGTKGASLGPYWAKHLTKALIYGHIIDPEINIDRIQEKGGK